MLNRVERNVRVFVFHPLGIGPFSLIMLIPHELLGTKKKKKKAMNAYGGFKFCMVSKASNIETNARE